MPCEASAGQPRYFFGSPFQHALVPRLTNKFVNTTAVNNWDTSEGAPATISPYERWTPDLSGDGSCEVHFCNPDGAPCSPWLRPFPTNTFNHTPGEKVDFAVTRKRGFKNVQASRCWNGRFGYLDIEASGGSDTWDPCSDPSTSVNWRSYNSEPIRTRYTRLDISATWEWIHNEWSGPPESTSPTTTTKDQSASLTQVINSAGILDTTALSVSPNTTQTEPLTEFPQNAFAALQLGFKHYASVASDMVKSVADTSFYVDGVTTVWTANSITVTNNNDGETIENETWGGGIFNRTIYKNFPDGGGYLVILSENYTLSETGLSYTKVTYNRIGEPGAAQGMVVDQITTQVTSTLSGAVSDGDIYSDIKTLLDQWDLADDSQYPWRTDIKVGVAPLVSRDELLTQEFDSTGFYVRDYSVPVTDPFGNTLGDPDWGGDTGYTNNPNPQTGFAKVTYNFPGHSSGTAISISVNNPFSHCAATSYAIAGGSLPPGVSLDGSSGEITGTVGDDGHYGVTILVTGATAAVTGDILGAPKPAGYQNFFDFLFTDIRGCCYEPIDNPGFKQWAWYQVGWGQDVVTFNTNTGCHLPLNCTQWNNWFQAVNKPAGAWIFYADQRRDYFPVGCISSSGESGAGDATNIVAQKWAEILERWPSQNFAKPAGDMKFWYDETRVYCATNVSGAGEGSTWSLIDPNTLLPPAAIESDDIWGGPSVGGFYAIAGYSTGVVTLGAKQFDVPSNWSSKSNGDDSQCFGPLRWADYPSLLGRVAVTTSGPGTSFTFVTVQPTFGMDSSTHQEQIDLYDSVMVLLASNVTATRISDTQCSIPSPHPSAAFITIHGASKWYGNDVGPKGDYAVLEWNSDFRSFGEYTRLSSLTDCAGSPVTLLPTTNTGGGPLTAETQFASFTQTPGCLPFAPCSPKVVCISPNGESFTNGLTYDFPGSFICDTQYGSKWWGYVQQTMTELFWQTPHRPCNIPSCAQWIADDGTCQENTPLNPPAYGCPEDEDYVDGETQPPVYCYRFPPTVEARLTVPSNYGTNQDESGPALPIRIQIGWLSPVDHVPGDGDVAYPPEPPGASKDGGIPGGATTAWEIHSRLCNSSAGGCRFNYDDTGC
jgi:hypothetical protein